MICPENSQFISSLAELGSGSTARIFKIDGGRAVQSRLCSMGLTPGMTVKVVCSDNGPIVLSVLGSRLMLGRNMATKIKVKPTP